MTIKIRTKYIDDGAVTEPKIADGAVTSAKLAAGVGGITQLTTDVTTATGGGVQAATVVALQGQPVSATAPSSGQVLSWSGSAWAPSTATTGGSAGGDLSGTYPNPTVAKLQGNAVSSTSPSSGQFLGWNGSSWAPTTPSAGITELTGDVTTATGGGSQAASVVRLQGRSVSSAAPTASQSLVWNAVASRWEPGTVTAAGSAGGDLSGTYPNPSVIKLQGNAVASTAPTANQALVWNALGSRWEPGTVATSGAAGGDLSGTYPNPTVAKLLGRSLNTTAPTANQAYVWDGSNWTATGVAKSGSWTLTGITGSNDGLPAFSATGLPIVVQPPTNKTNSVLGWLTDGTMGWVGMVASVLTFGGVDLSTTPTSSSGQT